jgi:hypothetical protein
MGCIWQSTSVGFAILSAVAAATEAVYLYMSVANNTSKSTRGHLDPLLTAECDTIIHMSGHN